MTYFIFYGIWHLCIMQCIILNNIYRWSFHTKYDAVPQLLFEYFLCYLNVCVCVCFFVFFFLWSFSYAFTLFLLSPSPLWQLSILIQRQNQDINDIKFIKSSDILIFHVFPFFRYSMKFVLDLNKGRKTCCFLEIHFSWIEFKFALKEMLNRELGGMKKKALQIFLSFFYPMLLSFVFCVVVKGSECNGGWGQKWNINKNIS